MSLSAGVRGLRCVDRRAGALHRPCLHGASRKVQRASANANLETMDMSEALTLANIRSSLIRQEDTIIFSIIERAQFARNVPVYTPDAIPVPGFDKSGRRYSLLEYVLRETEQLHGKMRRYTSPDEHAFFPDELPGMVLPPMRFDQVLASYSTSININTKIMDVYMKDVLPGLTSDGDDFNYGSTSILDVAILQALSKRIHYGMFVAEAKFRDHTEEYTRLIKAKDSDGIMALLTDKAVEDRVVQRVALKAATFGQDLGVPPNSEKDGIRLKIKPEVVAALYHDWVMPLTKEVEVMYLMRRLEDVK